MQKITPTSTDSILEWALYYRSLGFSVVPIIRGDKYPCIEWKEYQTRIASEDEIRLWYQHESSAQVGIVTGSISNFIVIDVDKNHGGLESAKSLHLPPTVTANTGGGGKHYLYRPPKGVVINNSTSQIAPGIDVRGNGGLIVVSPSIHPSGLKYEWAINPWDNEIVELPDDLYLQIKRDEKKTWESILVSIIPEGKRNVTATQLAGKLLSSIKDPLLWEGTVWPFLQWWNAEKTAKPMGVKELRTTYESITKRELKKQSKKEDQTMLLNAALENEGLELFHDTIMQPFARIFLQDHWEIWPCRGKDFKRWIAHKYWLNNKKPANEQVIKNMINTLEARACFDGPMHALETRIAMHDGSIWYDMSDKNWRAVKIADNGCQIVNNPPILFRRFNHQNEQVEPYYDGNVALILNYVNVSDDDQRLLLLVYIISCFVPDIPHPVLVLQGCQGSAKSSLSRIIRSVVDPSVTTTFTLPRKADELAQLFAHHWYVCFDNLTYLHHWQSDAICRAVTGDSFAKRELYTNDDDVFFFFKRCIGFNGILLTGMKSDLIERSIFMNLEKIDPEKRRDEAEIMNEFKNDLPFIIGGVFTVLSKAMKIRPSVKLNQLPRMADFALWGAAISEALGYTAQNFLDAYLNNATVQKEDLLREDLIVDLLIDFAEQEEEWEGTTTALYKKQIELGEKEGINFKKSKGWPKAPNSYSRKIKSLISVFSELGVILSQKGQRGWRVSTARKNTDDIVSTDTPEIFDM